jgi:hypothetical protein
VVVLNKGTDAYFGLVAAARMMVPPQSRLFLKHFYGKYN